MSTPTCYWPPKMLVPWYLYGTNQHGVHTWWYLELFWTHHNVCATKINNGFSLASLHFYSSPHFPWTFLLLLHPHTSLSLPFFFASLASPLTPLFAIANVGFSKQHSKLQQYHLHFLCFNSYILFILDFCVCCFHDHEKCFHAFIPNFHYSCFHPIFHYTML